MPRMFDILKGAGEGNDADDKKEKAPAKDSFNIQKEKLESLPLNFPKKILKTASQEEKKPEDHSLVSEKLISAVKKHGVDSQEKAGEIYESAVETINALLIKIRIKEDLSAFTDRLYALLDDIFNQLVLGDSILENIYENNEGEYYLPFHIVNVLILSTVLGLNIGFNKSRLSHLGMASIFYDVGMDALREITNQPHKLTEEEFKLIKTHVSKKQEVIEKNEAINEVMEETIRMHHERENGSGYPRGMKSSKINPYAKILGLVDTYEALTHDRPHRKGMNTHKAVKLLITSLKNDFDSDVMKTFINKMSVYPIGSIVKLDTGEVARVVSVQPGSPLRPVVMVLRDAFGEAIKERIIIDLSKQDFPAITDSV